MATFRMLSSGAFDPDTINAMTTAYQRACAAFDVADRTDPLKEVIANAILERAKTGERDAARLCEAVLKELLSNR
jgi:hypothetical protein